MTTHRHKLGTRLRGGCALLMLASVSACSDEPDSRAASTGGLSVTGALRSAPEQASEAIVLWSVSSGSPDYAYLWGRTPVDKASFTLSLEGPPPVEALNSYGLGVAIIMVVPRASNVPDGKLTDADERAFEEVSAASEQHAIIYVDRDVVDAMLEAATPEERQEALDHWMFDFPAGYGCGVGREAAPDAIFDSYVPVDCDEVRLEPVDADGFEFPNWT